MLRQLIEGETRESIQLRNRVTIEIHTASFRSTRGYTIVAALLDEIAYWPTDESSAEPDAEVLNALRPALATIPEAMLLAASSPHARKGALWTAYRRHYGRDNDPVLVWQATTRDMNASVPQSYVDAHMAEDPARAAAEYMAAFRSDLETFVIREAVDACISSGVRERPPMRGTSYRAFCDPSGGSADAMTLAIGHYEVGRQAVVIDAVREVRPPFSPELVVSEFSTLLKGYGIRCVSGDKYAGEWPRAQFQQFGIKYEPTAKSASDLYVDLLPLINSGQIELLDNERMCNQLCALERRTARSGRVSIDHPPNVHDDLINAVAGVASIISKPTYSLDAMDDDDPDGARAWRAFRLMQHIQRYG
jgi:hypothetical protein